MRDSSLELRSVSQAYDGLAVLSGVSFKLEAGEPTALLGPSGCGKSTALRLLAGLEAPSEGRVFLDGEVVSEAGRVILPPHCRGVAMVFQDLALWPNLSVLENVRLGQAGARLPGHEVRRRAVEALALCGIEGLAGRMPGKLSGGQQQRVALARAIATRPAFLFLDEPFSGLDLVTKDALLNQISALSPEQNFTVLLVTHDPQEMRALCRRAVVLNHGKVEEAGGLPELLERPRSETMEVFRRQLRL